MLSLTTAQKNFMLRYEDELIIGYHNPKGKKCFRVGTNPNVLYTTLTVRALIKKGLVKPIPGSTTVYMIQELSL
jgi:hypothetical protein